MSNFVRLKHSGAVTSYLSILESYNYIFNSTAFDFSVTVILRASRRHKETIFSSLILYIKMLTSNKMGLLFVLLGLAAASTSFRTDDANVKGTWSTSNNNLLRNGKEVLLHGLGSTCTEYLTRGIGMKCWADY